MRGKERERSGRVGVVEEEADMMVGVVVGRETNIVTSPDFLEISAARSIPNLQNKT